MKKGSYIDLLNKTKLKFFCVQLAEKKIFCSVGPGKMVTLLTAYWADNKGIIACFVKQVDVCVCVCMCMWVCMLCVVILLVLVYLRYINKAHLIKPNLFCHLLEFQIENNVQLTKSSKSKFIQNLRMKYTQSYIYFCKITPYTLIYT